MEILHIHIAQQGSDYIALRYFLTNPFDYQECRLPLIDVKALRRQAETDYYTRLPVDYAKTGQALYRWLDQSERTLSNALKQYSCTEGLILAIASDEGLAQLPWELLHDGQSFLVQKRPPIIPVRWVATEQKPIQIVDRPKNRPLNVLFMAASPLEVKPVLDYEAEEREILTATQRTPANLNVEESGELGELGFMVRDYENSYFDIFHLTGHGTCIGQQSYFFTENEYGEKVNSSAEDIVDALGYPLPPLIFLSGCHTGYSSSRTIPSMAESFLKMQALAVLGWGHRVQDIDATVAAGILYKELATGRSLPQTIALTYRTLIQKQVKDWHKLRLYVGMSLLTGLVTPPRTKGRKQLPKSSAPLEFRDDEGRLRVSSRENFVGRRRQLQNCLRTIKVDTEKVGVLIHGMGGCGKSSIASRLWERLPEYEKVLWWQQLNEPYLIRKIKDRLTHPTQLDLYSYLDNRQLSLKTRLVYVFRQLSEMGEKPFLFILDDFEWNLEPDVGQYRLKSEVHLLLAALVEAIYETGNSSRLIVTCRYKFNSSLSKHFFAQGLETLKGVELDKKLSRLEQFRSGSLSDVIRHKALSLADGNPRLLEFLNDEILGDQNVETKLTELDKEPKYWKEKVIWQDLYQLIDEPLLKVLSHCLTYEISVPMKALEVVCESLPNHQSELERALALGLIETSPEVHNIDRTYRVSRILPHIDSRLEQLHQDIKVKISRKASAILCKLWETPKNRDIEKWREVFRISFIDTENKHRFREGFFKALYLQEAFLDKASNDEAFSAFEDVVRENINAFEKTLDVEDLLSHLEALLKDGEWRKADEETTWIFQVIMLTEKHKDWIALLKNFPKNILRNINELWLSYSDNQFGFSVQKSIWNTIKVDPDEKTLPYSKMWIERGKEVGWAEEGNDDGEFINYTNLPFSQEASKGNLPALWTTREHRGWYDMAYCLNFAEGLWGGAESLLSRLD